MVETAAPEYTIGWQPQRGPQTALLACPVFEVFFGGARGGGKTDGMLGEWASHAALHGKNAVGLMIRRERVQLLETIERSRHLYGPLGARYSDQDKMWRWPNGARLRFAYLERDADADAYQGHSYTRVYVEELGTFLGTFPSASPVLRLMATLRSGAGVPCGFRATGNPGGPGHQWVGRNRSRSPGRVHWFISGAAIPRKVEDTALRIRCCLFYREIGERQRQARPCHHTEYPQYLQGEAVGPPARRLLRHCRQPPSPLLGSPYRGPPPWFSAGIRSR
jgi:hypothetical protein